MGKMKIELTESEAMEMVKAYIEKHLAINLTDKIVTVRDRYGKMEINIDDAPEQEGGAE